MSTMIYIARHAWAYECGDPRWPDDSLRELEPEGVERYERMIQCSPSAILLPKSSPRALTRVVVKPPTHYRAYAGSTPDH